MFNKDDIHVLNDYSDHFSQFLVEKSRLKESEIVLDDDEVLDKTNSIQLNIATPEKIEVLYSSIVDLPLNVGAVVNLTRKKLDISNGSNISKAIFKKGMNIFSLELTFENP